jgi:hypothetical protein
MFGDEVARIVEVSQRPATKAVISRYSIVLELNRDYGIGMHRQSEPLRAAEKGRASQECEAQIEGSTAGQIGRVSRSPESNTAESPTDLSSVSYTTSSRYGGVHLSAGV